MSSGSSAFFLAEGLRWYVEASFRSPTDVDDPDRDSNVLGTTATRVQATAVREFLRALLIQNVVVVLLGLAFVALDARAFDATANVVLLCVTVTAKTVYFVVGQARRVVTMAKLDLGYHRYVLLLLSSIFFVVASFAVDFGCLHTIDPGSFSGFVSRDGFLAVGFQCFALSLLVFSNVGPIGATPVTLPAQFVTMLEALLSFLTLIILFSDFVSLRESLRDEAERAKGESDRSVGGDGRA